MSYEPLQKNIRQMYLNPNDADVVFLIDGERIPSHKGILRTMSEYFVKMFGPSWYNENEIVFRKSELDNIPPEYDHSISAKSFKEFLKFAYDVPRKLTMDNIRGVIDLANGGPTLDEDRTERHADRILMECEEFLKTSITKKTIRQMYQWARLYNMKSLMTEVILHTESALKSKDFHKFEFHFLQMILTNSSLPCEEYDIFNACIKWAKGACRTNLFLDPDNLEHLRGQLNVGGTNLLFEIRFTAMTSKDAATCIRSYPKLFKKDELREIICMVGHHRNDLQSNKFNWKPRHFNLEWSNGQLVDCSRFITGDKGKKTYKIKRCETTRFTCNRRMTLKGIKCELSRNDTKFIHLQINEINSDGHSVELLSPASQALTVHFNEKQTCVKHDSFLAHIQLNENILLRPNYKYEISITFAFQVVDLKSLSSFKQNVRFNHDLVIHFDQDQEKYRGIVASLSIRRFDDRKFLRKIINNPKLWMWIIVMALILCLGSALYVWPKPLFYMYDIIRDIARYVLYFFVGVLILMCCSICGLAKSNSNQD